VLLVALGLSTDVAAQQPATQQANVPQTTVVSTTNTGTGSSSQTTTQVVQNQSSVSQTQTNQGATQQVTTNQTTVATGGQTQVTRQPSSQASTSPLATAASPAVTRATEAMALAAGCSNVVFSWPMGTSLAEVAAAMTPASALTSIFKLDAGRGRFRGYTPSAPAFANDYTAVEAPLEAVFVCVNQAASLARPSS
jgi:hypothetical protein